MLVTFGAQRVNLHLYRTSLISVLSALPALCLNSSLLFDCYFLPRREYILLRFHYVSRLCKWNEILFNPQIVLR